MRRRFHYLLSVLTLCAGVFAAQALFGLLTPEPKPRAIPQPKPAPKAAPKPTPKTEPKPKPKATPKVESKPSPKTAPIEQILPEAKPSKTFMPPKDEPIRYITPEKRLQQSLILNGILVSGKQHYAIINNEVVQVGDTVEGAKVIYIGKEEVRLEYEDSTVTLYSRM